MAPPPVARAVRDALVAGLRHALVIALGSLCLVGIVLAWALSDLRGMPSW